MDLFAVPRTTFTLYLKLVQFPFEVGMRLIGGARRLALSPSTA